MIGCLTIRTLIFAFVALQISGFTNSFIMSSFESNEAGAKKGSVGAAGSDSCEGGGVSSNQGEGSVPLLPEADPNANIPSIKLGETISFEEMGPIILNTDGSTRRIDNWDQMTEREREVTWRRISKRNEERRKKLLQQQQEQLEQQKSQEETTKTSDDNKQEKADEL